VPSKQLSYADFADFECLRPIPRVGVRTLIPGHVTEVAVQARQSEKPDLHQALFNFIVVVRETQGDQMAPCFLRPPEFGLIHPDVKYRGGPTGASLGAPGGESRRAEGIIRPKKKLKASYDTKAIRFGQVDPMPSAIPFVPDGGSAIVPVKIQDAALNRKNAIFR
jgi:hypothetical protein